MTIRAHQPGAEPLKEDERITNPATEPLPLREKPVRNPTRQPLPVKEPVKTVVQPAPLGAGSLFLLVTLIRCEWNRLIEELQEWRQFRVEITA